MPLWLQIIIVASTLSGLLFVAFAIRLKFLEKQAEIDLSTSEFAHALTAQQTMLEAHRAFPQFDGGTEGEWLAWLRKILSHNTQDFIRRMRTEKRGGAKEIPLNAGGDGESFFYDPPADEERVGDAAQPFPRISVREGDRLAGSVGARHHQHVRRAGVKEQVMEWRVRQHDADRIAAGRHILAERRPSKRRQYDRTGRRGEKGLVLGAQVRDLSH